MYKVQANKDQLEKAGLDNEFLWQPATTSTGLPWPNRVEQMFVDLEHARRVYSRLTAKGMVAFKNWI